MPLWFFELFGEGDDKHFWILAQPLLYTYYMDEVVVKVKKTSKAVDRFIKVITFLSFVLFAITLYIHKFRSGDIYKSQVALCDTVWSQGMTDSNPLNNPIQTTFLKTKNNCFLNAKRTSEIWGKISFISFDITILLPFIYFGSKKIISDTSNKIVKVNTSL